MNTTTRLTIIVEAPTTAPSLFAALIDSVAKTIEKKGLPPNPVTRLKGPEGHDITALLDIVKANAMIKREDY